ncbi:MAG: zinc-ribbon domain-containing protein [Ruminococcaceae bacterium]|nr:zinc-ribbon domain-containing protein [Oscillospiraceae bacterium]
MFCPYCGKELDDGSKFCIYCGKRVDEERAEETAVEATESVPEAAAETVEKAVETMDSIPEAVAETSETAVEATDSIPEAVTETVEAAVETTDSIPEAVTETVEAAAETTESIPEAVAETVETAVETVADTAPEEVAVENDGAVDVSALVKNKKVLIIAAALLGLVLLVIIAVISSVSASSGGTGIKGNYLVQEDGGEGIIIYNGNKVKRTDISKDAIIKLTSLDNSKAVLDDNGKALYYLNGDKISKITEDYDLRMVLSDDGSTVVYLYDGALYTYRDGNNNKIANIENELVAFVTSPNGDTVAYAEKDGDKVSSYACKGGKVIDLDTKMIPLSVSNGGGVIYGQDKNNRLGYIKKLKPDSFESIKSMNSMFAPIFSSDKKQVLFTSDIGTYYFDTSLKEEIKVTGNAISLIYPAGGVWAYDDFKSFIAYSDGKVIHFTRKGKDFDKETLASSIDFSDYRLSSDGKTLVYRTGNDLYKVSVANPEKKEQIASEVIMFDTNDNLKRIYFNDCCLPRKIQKIDKQNTKNKPPKSRKSAAYIFIKWLC